MLIEKVPVPKDAGATLFRSCIEHMADPAPNETLLYLSAFNVECNRAKINGKLDPDPLIREMVEHSAQNIRCKNPVFYSLVQYRRSETPNEEQCKEAVEIFMKEFHIERYKVIWATHEKNGILHTHILVNKIDPETLLVMKSPLYIKANNRAGWKTAKKQGWISENAFNPGRYVDTENGTELDPISYERRGVPDIVERISDEQGKLSAIRIAQRDVLSALLNAKSWKELHEKLYAKGIFIVKVQRGGLLYVNKIPIKISSVSSLLSMQRLEDRLGPFETVDYDKISIRKENTGSTIFDAIKEGSLEKVKKLVEKNEDCIFEKDDCNWEPIHYAAYVNNVDIVKYLIEEVGVELDWPEDDEGMTPLFIAVLHQKTDVAKYLISKGAYVDYDNDVLRTPLIEAAGNGDIELAKLLIEHGADIDLIDTACSTPLCEAIQYKRFEMIDFLIQMGADLNMLVGEESGSLLHIVLRQQHYSPAEKLKVLEKLLSTGADPNIPDDKGSLPLHLAANSDDWDAVKLLLKYTE